MRNRNITAIVCASVLLLNVCTTNQFFSAGEMPADSVVMDISEGAPPAVEVDIGPGGGTEEVAGVGEPGIRPECGSEANIGGGEGTSGDSGAVGTAGTVPANAPAAETTETAAAGGSANAAPASAPAAETTGTAEAGGSADAVPASDSVEDATGDSGTCDLPDTKPASDSEASDMADTKPASDSEGTMYATESAKSVSAANSAGTVSATDSAVSESHGNQFSFDSATSESAKEIDPGSSESAQASPAAVPKLLRHQYSEPLQKATSPAEPDTSPSGNKSDGNKTPASAGTPEAAKAGSSTDNTGIACSADTDSDTKASITPNAGNPGTPHTRSLDAPNAGSLSSPHTRNLSSPDAGSLDSPNTGTLGSPNVDPADKSAGKSADNSPDKSAGSSFSITLSNKVYGDSSDSSGSTSDSPDASNDMPATFVLSIFKDFLANPDALTDWIVDSVGNYVRSITLKKSESQTVSGIPRGCPVTVTVETPDPPSSSGNGSHTQTFSTSYIVDGTYMTGEESTFSFNAPDDPNEQPAAGGSDGQSSPGGSNGQSLSDVLAAHSDLTLVRIADRLGLSKPLHIINDSDVDLPLSINVTTPASCQFSLSGANPEPCSLEPGKSITVTIPKQSFGYLAVDGDTQGDTPLGACLTPLLVTVNEAVSSLKGFGENDGVYACPPTLLENGQYVLFQVDDVKTGTDSEKTDETPEGGNDPGDDDKPDPGPGDEPEKPGKKDEPENESEAPGQKDETENPGKKEGESEKPEPEDSTEKPEPEDSTQKPEVIPPADIQPQRPETVPETEDVTKAPEAETHPQAPDSPEESQTRLRNSVPKDNAKTPQTGQKPRDAKVPRTRETPRNAKTPRNEKKTPDRDQGTPSAPDWGNPGDHTSLRMHIPPEEASLEAQTAPVPTGDETPVGKYAILLAVALLTAACCMIAVRRRRHGSEA